MAVKKGDKVKVEYEGTLEDGSVFDSSKNHDEALEFEAGAGQVISGFDNAIIGMEKGEEKTVKIDAKDAYGNPNPQMIQKVPKAQMPEGIKVGMTLGAALPNGQQIPARVTSIADDVVTVDLNHPLAGKNLTFKIKVLDINLQKD